MLIKSDTQLDKNYRDESQPTLNELLEQEVEWGGKLDPDPMSLEDFLSQCG